MIDTGGFDQGWDGHLHADLVYQPASGAEQLIGSADQTLSMNDAGTVLGIHATIASAAVPAKCGDHLALRVSYLAGSHGIIEFSAMLQIP